MVVLCLVKLCTGLLIVATRVCKTVLALVAALFGQFHLTTVYMWESNEQLSCCHQGGTENVISVSSSCQDKSCHGLVGGHKGSCTQACHRAPCHPPSPHTRPVVVATTLTPLPASLTPSLPPLPVFPARHAATSACYPCLKLCLCPLPASLLNASAFCRCEPCLCDTFASFPCPFLPPVFL